MISAGAASMIMSGIERAARAVVAVCHLAAATEVANNMIRLR